MDFTGTTPGTVAVTSTSVGFRLRQAFAEVQYGERFFLAAGQAFTLMTAQKDQLSIWPSDIEMSQAVDTNYLAGIDLGSDASGAFDVAPVDAHQLGRVGWRIRSSSSEVDWSYPARVLRRRYRRPVQHRVRRAERAQLDARYCHRVAFNPVKPLHVDVGGVVRVFRHTVSPYDDDFKDVGGGASINARYNLTAGTKLLMQTGFGSGFGRYIGGLVPDATFRRDGSIRSIGTTSWVGGVEQKISPTLSLAGYYSGLDTDASFDLDTDGSYIGFGFPARRTRTTARFRKSRRLASYQFVQSPDRGSGQFSLQASWLKRDPSSQGNGLPSAKAFLFFAQVRYNLP